MSALFSGQRATSDVASADGYAPQVIQSGHLDQGDRTLI